MNTIIVDSEVFRAFLRGQDTLKSYTPADRHYTSNEEIKRISEALSLKAPESAYDVERMRSMRNMVVLFYEEHLDHTERHSEQWENYWQAMMSVTTIIDHVSCGATAF